MQKYIFFVTNKTLQKVLLLKQQMYKQFVYQADYKNNNQK